jgi:hypothetical protein
MLVRATWIVFSLSVAVALQAADNPRHIDPAPGTTAVVTLPQNWTDAESNWFYNAPQGSRLIPYDWFLHLEEVESPDRFRSGEHVRGLGYIARRPDPSNPDGLPIGFIKDEPYDDGTPALGVTCAACHTSLIRFGEKALVIDGGPALGDFERFLKELTAALQATANDNAKFERFAAAVLPRSSAGSLKTALRESLRTVAGQRASYNDRNLPKLQRDRFGPGRVDAFGAIFNEVSTTFLGIPENVQPANAPVSYPCLWDAPQHDRVQWNGAAENRVSPLGEVLFGTTEVGALGRNSGEVLGVFGHAEINPHELLIPRRYAATINKPNLKRIEDTLKTLWSPQWPVAIFGDLDATRMARGKVLYDSHCIQCHAAIDRSSPSRRVAAQLVDAGTDKTMIRNFGRQSKTGILKRRRKTLLGTDRFGNTDATGVILKHVVERVILDPDLSPQALQQALLTGAGSGVLEKIDSLNPGYRMTATIEAGDRKLVGQFDSLTRIDGGIRISGGRFHLLARGRDALSEGLGDDVVDFRSLATLRAAADRLEGVLKIEPEGSAEDAAESPETVVKGATVKIGYKARPLNGVWATAPYLHNGSVLSLDQLLKPAVERARTFHVGSQEFDPVNVGFRDDPHQPLFDTTLEGNSNSGHEYGAGLAPEERRDLLEYLKSL